MVNPLWRVEHCQVDIILVVEHRSEPRWSILFSHGVHSRTKVIYFRRGFVVGALSVLSNSTTRMVIQTVLFVFTVCITRHPVFCQIVVTYNMRRHYKRFASFPDDKFVWFDRNRCSIGCDRITQTWRCSPQTFEFVTVKTPNPGLHGARITDYRLHMTATKNPIKNTTVEPLFWGMVQPQGRI